MVQSLWKTGWAVCCKVIHACSTYDPAIPPVGMKPCGYTKLYTWGFIATLFIIIIIWEQPKCPSASQRINKSYVYPYNEIILSDKKKKPLVHATKWMNFKSIMLSEGCRHKKQHCMILFIWFLESENYNNIKQSTLPDTEDERTDYKGSETFFGQVIEMFPTLTDVMAAWLSSFQNTSSYTFQKSEFIIMSTILSQKSKL